MSRPTSFRLHIRPLFRDLDVAHMQEFGVDLDTHAGVTEQAPTILRKLKSVNRPMPPKEDDGPWPEEWIALFERWIAESCPE